MSHSRKHLTTTVLTSLPLPSEAEKVVKVIELRGANICEVEEADGQRYLVQVPTRFRKLVWIKRGNFLIINRPTNWDNLNYKVRAMVLHVLFPDQIKNIKKEGLWPQEFQDAPIEEPKKQQQEDDEGELDEYLVNSNHVYAQEESDSDDEDEDNEDDDDDEDEENG